MTYEVILLNANAVICAITAARVISFRRGASKHNRLMSFIAWLMAVASGSVTIRVLTGEYFYTDWTAVLINLLLCLMVLRAKGNISHLMKGKIYDSARNS